jgi:glutamate-ammonia-ligase adenylyltransferase
MAQFCDATQGLPLPADPRQAVVGRENWLDAVRTLGADVLAAAERLDRTWARPLLDAVCGNSPYLASLMARDPAFSLKLLEAGPDEVAAEILAAVEAARDVTSAAESPAKLLRLAKRRLALTTALADIAGLWTLEQVTGTLSRFAEAALDVAAAYLVGEALQRGVFALAEDGSKDEAPLRRSGLIILGVGKLGAGELNYSSDIDLIVFYDPDRVRPPAGGDLQPIFNRLTRQLVRLIAETTVDGYVFRTDLRLRPDPGSTPLAISVLGAETYYETLGQNWERAALIKAKPVAADLAAAAVFLDRLRPFIWRKNLDFAAIQDIHSIKRQINAHRGGGRIALAGHNLKLGRGGIREIEFFAQTQQLIWGGRLPEVRQRGTIAALDALAAAGKVAPEVAATLGEAYRFLRRVEHRLQMTRDEQTHTLPKEPEKFAALATFLGYADAEAFGEAMLGVLRRVESHYAELFEEAPALTLANGVAGNLVFTGADADPETIVTLQHLGFKNPAAVDAAVRGWHHGRYRAMRSTRARELLTELMPHLLQAIAAKPDPDAAFLAFDRFLAALPAGVQLFSLFHAHPDLLSLLTDILGVAPRVGGELARRPSLLDSVLSADFFAPLPPMQALTEELAALLARARSLEEVLDLSRRFAAERRFQIGVQQIRGLIDPAEAGHAYAAVAEAAIRGLKPRIEEEFARHHGGLAGEGLAVVAMGKLGSGEMTAQSDLDLIFIYDAPATDMMSDGRRPLAAAQYYARLSQRLINALTAPTAEGQLYAVDMRLRPSGNAGPIATSLTSFRRYHAEEAWTWEHMALTRARVVAGPLPLAAAIDGAIREALIRPRDPARLVLDVAEMRERMAREHPAASAWDVKHRRGGLIDVEFIVQYLELLHAPEHPEVLAPATAEALRRLRAAALIAPATGDVLEGALRLWHGVQSRLRLTLDEPFAAGNAEAAHLIAAAVDGLFGLDAAALARQMHDVAAAVREVFAELIERPGHAADRAVHNVPATEVRP